jgi:hypothetical protein
MTSLIDFPPAGDGDDGEMTVKKNWSLSSNSSIFSISYSLDDSDDSEKDYSQ